MHARINIEVVNFLKRCLSCLFCKRKQLYFL